MTPPLAPMTPSSWLGGELDDLSATECWRLLASQGVGRIAYADAGGPVVLPLNYALRDRTVWFRTASYSQLAMHVPDQVVGFQIDHVDVRSESGWSVLVRGRARHVRGSEVGAALEPQLSPWPEGPRTMMFRIEAPEISGRSLQAS